jgi:hypothetical protein
MKHYAIGTFIGLIGLTSALAQNGDRKDHNKMGKIVPEKLIPPAPVRTVDEALKAFTIEKGYIIEPVAAEPLSSKISSSPAPSPSFPAASSMETSRIFTS